MFFSFQNKRTRFYNFRKSRKNAVGETKVLRVPSDGRIGHLIMELRKKKEQSEHLNDTHKADNIRTKPALDKTQFSNNLVM